MQVLKTLLLFLLSGLFFSCGEAEDQRKFPKPNEKRTAFLTSSECEDVNTKGRFHFMLKAYLDVTKKTARKVCFVTNNLQSKTTLEVLGYEKTASCEPSYKKCGLQKKGNSFQYLFIY